MLVKYFLIPSLSCEIKLKKFLCKQLFKASVISKLCFYLIYFCGKKVLVLQFCFDKVNVIASNPVVP